MEISYRDNRGRWSLRIFWSTFVRAKTEFNFFLAMVALNLTGTIGRAIAGWRGLGSELTRAFLWLLIVLSAVFIVGIVIAVIRSSLVDARDVTGREARGSIEAVSALLASGQLDESALVDVGRGWQSIGECFEFDEAVALARSRRTRRRVIIALAIVASVAAAGWSALA